MKAPLSWLKEFVDIFMTPDEIAHMITMAGLEVTDIHYSGVAGAALVWERDKIVVANVLEVRQHPNADRLVVADVDYGGDAPHTVVTGAPNLFPYKETGRLTHPLKVVFAKEGATLYDGHKEGKVMITLKGRPVRGIMSDAMLCSEKELGISDEHEGILFLDDDAPVGTPLQDVLGDVVFDIDLTPNLARCLSIVGIARELSALTGVPLHIPSPQVAMHGAPIEGRVQVTVEEPHLCPRFTAALVENITIKPSPGWMQRRLINAGMRPINNIVDISNYVMLEWGEPTHAFDADKVADWHLVTRLARPDEQLTTLDGKERLLAPPNDTRVPPLLVCDPNKPLGLAGVMGGKESEVSDTTTTILLEAATWEPAQIRRTAQRFKIPSEASHRFERGVDIEIAPIAQRRALELMRTLADGTVANGLIDVYSEPWQTPQLDLPTSEVSRIVGIHLTAYDIAAMLRALGFMCEIHSNDSVGDLAGFAMSMGFDQSFVRVFVPSFRRDVTCLADLCEELARIYGYDNIPTTLLSDELPPIDTHPERELEHIIRDMLIGCGLYDVITYSLTSMEAVARVSPAAAEPSRYMRVTNAVSPEREYLQQSLLPSLLDAVVMNLRERKQVMLFEIGRVFLPTDSTTLTRKSDHEKWLPHEPHHLAIALGGTRTDVSWHDAHTTKTAALLDYFDLKGIIDVLLQRLHIPHRVVFLPLTDDERFHPGRAATIALDIPDTDAVVDTSSKKQSKKHKQQQATTQQVIIGVLGEVHPLVCERLGCKIERVAAAEINLDALRECVAPGTYTPISRYPATVQDLAVVVDSRVPTQHVAECITRAAGELLESLVLFDVYRGEQIAANKHSLAYRLTFRSADKTLSDNALAKIRTNIVKAVERELSATLRS